jgi:hypothetical protein
MIMWVWYNNNIIAFFTPIFTFKTSIEVLFVKVTVFILILFASLPDCDQNETAVSDEQYSLSDF